MITLFVLSLWIKLSFSVIPATFDAVTTVDGTSIGWVKFFDCTEASSGATYTFPADASKNDFIPYFESAISMQVLPGGTGPTNYNFDSPTNEYAIMADICSEGVLQLNEGLEMAYPIGIASEDWVDCNWLGTSDALYRLEQNVNGCKCTTDRAQIAAQHLLYHACCNHDGLHLTLYGRCELDFAEVTPGLNGLAIWLGFAQERYWDCPSKPYQKATIRPNKNDKDGVSVIFADDHRHCKAKNNIKGNKWNMISPVDNPLKKWPMMVDFRSIYGFNDDDDDSKLVITLNGDCKLRAAKTEWDEFDWNDNTVWSSDAKSSPCNDMYFAFLFGENRFITLRTTTDGVQIYPAPGGFVADGDPTDLLSTATDGDSLKSVLAGGDENNWFTLSTRANRKLPLTFELINNLDVGTFTVSIKSKTFKKGGLSATFNEAMDPGSCTKMFATPDWPSAQDQVVRIRKVIVNGKKFIKLDGEEEEEIFYQAGDMFLGLNDDNYWYYKVGIIVVVISFSFCLLLTKFMKHNNKKLSERTEMDPLLIN